LPRDDGAPRGPSRIAYGQLVTPSLLAATSTLLAAASAAGVAALNALWRFALSADVTLSIAASRACTPCLKASKSALSAPVALTSLSASSSVF
jgi:hypothetical protein